MINSIEQCRELLNKIWEEYDKLKEENYTLKQKLEAVQKVNEQLYKLP